MFLLAHLLLPSPGNKYAYDVHEDEMQPRCEELEVALDHPMRPFFYYRAKNVTLYSGVRMTDLFSPRFILIWNSRKCAVFAKIFLINMWHQGVEMGSKLTPETSRTFLKGPYFYDIRSGGERLRALPSQQADKRKEGYKYT